MPDQSPRTVPREPWRGGQVCGYQTNVGGWSEGPAAYCGEYKQTGSPVCSIHDAEMRGENGGVLPRFAPGNALGLSLTSCSQSWLVRDHYGDLVAGSDDVNELKTEYGFTLSWEPDEGDDPVPATAEEVLAWETAVT